MCPLRNARRQAGVFLCSLGLVSCALSPDTQQRVTPFPADLPESIELTATPFYPQARYQCGPAALATVLATQNPAVTPAALVDAVYVPALHGSLKEELMATARHYGMLAYPLHASLEDLLREIAAGNPVVVLQNLGTGWFPRWHFAVAIGYDLASREIILRSGTLKRKRNSLKHFTRTWSRSTYWALVVLPAGQLPASARWESYLQAVHDLEAAGQPAAAQLAYQAATRRWPNNPLTWVTYGNSLHTTTDYGSAETAFRAAIQLAPEDPRTWNNLAYTLLQNGCPRQARRAAQCATERVPDEASYRETLTEIVHRAQGADQPHCLPLDC